MKEYKKDKIVKILNPIFDLPNINGEKGYIGSIHIKLPIKDNDARKIETVRKFAKAFYKVYGNDFAVEPMGTDEEVFSNDKFNKFVIELAGDMMSARRVKKQTLPEFERFGLITRKKLSKHSPTHFKLTKLGYKIALLKDDESSYQFYEKMVDFRKKYVRERFHKDSDWKQFYEAVYQHTFTFKYLYWFDLWLLSFTIGKKAIYDYDQIRNFSLEIRNSIGIKDTQLMAEKLYEFKDELEKIYSPNSLQKWLGKKDKINISGLIEKYNIFAEYLTYTGLYKKENVGYRFILTFADNTNPPKTIRNNSTDKSLYYETELDKIETDNHHIIPHALATQMNGLNELINNKWNKLSISERDHKKFPTHISKNQYRKIDLVNGNIHFINISNPSDVITLEDIKHINLEMLKDKVIPYNRQLLKKLK